MKVVSLVPSLTHLLFDLGLNKEIVGRTKFCVHPKNGVKNIPIIGGTKNIRIDTINQLEPDLIIASKEENVKNQVEALKAEVLVTDIITLKDNQDVIHELSNRFNKVEEGKFIQNSINHEFKKLNKLSQKPSILYLIWREPYMTIGHDTFIHEMIEKAGFRNVYESSTRYPVIAIESLPEKPEYIFLSSEPYPFCEKHIAAVKTDFPTSKIILTDGEMFSWYGSYIKKSPDYFLRLRQDLLLN